MSMGQRTKGVLGLFAIAMTWEEEDKDEDVVIMMTRRMAMLVVELEGTIGGKSNCLPWHAHHLVQSNR